MSLKTSFFNKSLFCTDIKRFWWISLLETFLLLIACVIPFYDRCISYSEAYSYPPTLSIAICIPFFIMFGVGIPILLMSYMHSSAPMCAIHSLPIKRKTVLTTKLVSSAVIALFPILINSLILFGFLADENLRRFCETTHILKWMFTGSVYTLVIISLTVFVNMITGNTVGTLVFSQGFMWLPIALEIMLIDVLDETIYGYHNNFTIISRYLYLEEELLTMFPTCLIYPALIAIFIAGAFILYKHRKLENHGEVIAFNWLKPLFMGMVSAFTSFLGFFYFWAITDSPKLIHLLPFGILGTIIAKMISRKSLSLKGMWKPVLVYVSVTLCFIGVIKFDLTGYEKRIPKPEEIDCAKITYDYDYSNMPGRISPYFTDAEDIKNVMALHNHLIENRHEKHEDNTVSIPIEYRLKNGEIVSRTYFVSYESDGEFLKPLYETPQLKAAEFPIVNGTEKDYIRFTISKSVHTQPVLEIYPSNENFDNLKEALITDIKALTYEDYIIHPNDYLLELNAHYVPQGADSSKLTSMDEVYRISEKYINTLAVLKKIGFTIE